MTAVYVIGSGSRHDDLELRFSLRSLEQYVSGIDRVIVVGHRPRWLVGIEHVPWPDRFACKERNIMDKILQACRISPEFLQVHDDYFALGHQEVNKVPNWADGDLAGTATRARTPVYRRSLQNTHDALSRLGLPVHHFDVHTPIVYNAAKFAAVMELYDWTVQGGYVVKSLYANTLRIEPTPLADLKLRNPMLTLRGLVEILKGRPWWSVGDRGLTPEVRALLAALYPEKSRFEL